MDDKKIEKAEADLEKAQAELKASKADIKKAENAEEAAVADMKKAEAEEEAAVADMKKAEVAEEAAEKKVEEAIEELKEAEHHHETFEIQIDRVVYKVKEKHMTGSQLRALPNPPIGPDRDLWEVVQGGSDLKIGDTDIVEMRMGLCFFSAPAHINPGIGKAKSESMTTLPSKDAEYLEKRFGNGSHRISSEANMMCLEFPDFSLPAGFDRQKATLLLRLQPGYPDVPPDMWWFDPPIRRMNGQTIPQTEVIEHYLGRGWQRWSRHLSPGQWRPGVDSLESFVALLRKELERSAARSMP